MSKEYGYARISTPKQNIDRQVRNILAAHPQAHMIKEVFTGTKFQGRKELDKLLRTVQPGDTIIFDSVSRMSRNAEEGFANPDNPPARPLIPAESVPLNPEEAAPLAMAFSISSPDPLNNSVKIPEKISSEIVELPSLLVFKRPNHLPAVSRSISLRASFNLVASLEFIAFLRFPILLNDYSMIKLIVQ